jgi:proteasome accessory factor C
MSDTAIERTSRALDLIPYLLEHPGTHIEFLAKAFNTTSAEISKELDIIFMCGLPGYTHLELVDISQEDGFVSVVDPQNLTRPRDLTGIEATSIVLGLKNLELLTPNRQVLGLIRGLLEKLQSHWKIQAPEVSADLGLLPGSEHMNAINDAIRSRNQISIEYLNRSKDAVLHYDLSPTSIYANSGNLYLSAFSHSSSGMRNFRLDGIKKMTILDIRATAGAPQFGTPEISVQVSIPRTDVVFRERNSEIIEEVSFVGERAIVTLKSSNSEWLLRSLSAIPGEVEVIAPVELAAAFKDRNRRALNGYTWNERGSA